MAKEAATAEVSVVSASSFGLGVISPDGRVAMTKFLWEGQKTVLGRGRFGVGEDAHLSSKHVEAMAMESYVTVKLLGSVPAYIQPLDGNSSISSKERSRSPETACKLKRKVPVKARPGDTLWLSVSSDGSKLRYGFRIMKLSPHMSSSSSARTSFFPSSSRCPLGSPGIHPNQSDCISDVKGCDITQKHHVTKKRRTIRKPYNSGSFSSKSSDKTVELMAGRKMDVDKNCGGSDIGGLTVDPSEFKVEIEQHCCCPLSDVSDPSAPGDVDGEEGVEEEGGNKNVGGSIDGYGDNDAVSRPAEQRDFRGEEEEEEEEEALLHIRSNQNKESGTSASFETKSQAGQTSHKKAFKYKFSNTQQFRKKASPLKRKLSKVTLLLEERRKKKKTRYLGSERKEILERRAALNGAKILRSAKELMQSHRSRSVVITCNFESEKELKKALIKEACRNITRIRKKQQEERKINSWFIENIRKRQHGLECHHVNWISRSIQDKHHFEGGEAEGEESVEEFNGKIADMLEETSKKYFSSIRRRNAFAGAAAAIRNLDICADSSACTYYSDSYAVIANNFALENVFPNFFWFISFIFFIFFVVFLCFLLLYYSTQHRAYPRRIQTFEQAIAVRGIGKKIACDIVSFLNTGHSRLNGLRNDSKTTIMELFQSIHDIGPNKAEILYKEGFRTLDTIKGHRVLTPAANVCLALRDELSERIPRAEALSYLREAKKCIADLSSNLRVELCGSISRGKSDSRDIDLMFYDVSLRDGENIKWLKPIGMYCDLLDKTYDVDDEEDDTDDVTMM
eukprot:jgi/Bigna1/144448/aug1.87_g19156